MLATSHALVGVSLVSAIPDLKIALPVIFLSHFFLDLIPHWDFVKDENHGLRNNNKTGARLQLVPRASLDVIFGFLLVWWLFGQRLELPQMAIAVFVSLLPDFVESPYYIFGLNFLPSILAKKLQSRLHHKVSFFWGILIQLAVVVPILWWTLT